MVPKSHVTGAVVASASPDSVSESNGSANVSATCDSCYSNTKVSGSKILCEELIYASVAGTTIRCLKNALKERFHWM